MTDKNEIQISAKVPTSSLCQNIPSNTELSELASLFKVFGDVTRLHILFVLSESPARVCDIAGALQGSQSAVSHQLGILRASKLVTAHRQGKSVVYSLADDHVRRIIGQGRDHVEE